MGPLKKTGEGDRTLKVLKVAPEDAVRRKVG